MKAAHDPAEQVYYTLKMSDSKLPVLQTMRLVMKHLRYRVFLGLFSLGSGFNAT